MNSVDNPEFAARMRAESSQISNRILAAILAVNLAYWGSHFWPNSTPKHVTITAQVLSDAEVFGTSAWPSYKRVEPSRLQPHEFMGYTCTQDCSGHEAGYEWADDNSIDDTDSCTGNSQSLIEGCEAYVEENE